MKKHTLAIGAFLCLGFTACSQQKPNIVFIYADDLGYGDLGCYGATQVHTPNIDRLSKNGLRFTNAHASSATCTPSRYSILTGQYAWRKAGTGIAPGDAAALIKPNRTTWPSVLKQAGYTTAAIGKWHLGLGEDGKGPDWNNEIKPGPLEIGFDYAYYMPATLDRVPCVYVENHRVVNLDPADPITVSYKNPIGDWPTGKDHPELLKMQSSPGHGHNQTIVNGIGRIGYMTGGKAALWNDETIADTLVAKTQNFIRLHSSQPFFVYLATGDIHVPRDPNNRFKNKSGLGARGDAILQLDWTVGEVLKTLDSLQLTQNTIIIVTSDNGPVVDDGYQDGSVENLGTHKPAGELRGGKYSAFDAGTRVPFIVHWPRQVKPGVSAALISQIDLPISFTSFTHQSIPAGEMPDGFDMTNVLLGRSQKGRTSVIEHAGTLAIIEGDWKYIKPGKGPRINKLVNIELGNDEQPQLYNLKTDIREQHNVAAQHPDITAKLAASLQRIEESASERNIASSK
ncbi:sulfatase family protein [Deminuibacter soli]|uniref:Arylsulfatase n=1 Tax=Deminuibacter soli TaxID=2291815 RepID=A0A3E1NNU3_9BACT|nr:arylsulfatase [Deminuibacter soli]RFM29567.1 arylsulfatase [Deminuibacter soli]